MQCFTQIKPNVVRASCRPHAQRRAVVVPLAHAGHTSQASSQQAAAIAIAASSAFLMGSYAANALGIESMDLLPSSIEKPAALSKYAEEQKQKLADADEELLKRSDTNKAKNRRDVQNKYCYRQAELGVGDCGGLRFIPGLTDNGKQKTPQWLADLLGLEVPDSNPSGGKSLKELIYDNDK